MIDLIKWEDAQPRLYDFQGTCQDFGAVTDVNEFNIANCPTTEGKRFIV